MTTIKEGTIVIRKNLDIPSDALDDLHRHAEEARAIYHMASTADDLLRNKAFARGVELLATEEYSDDRILDYLVGENIVVQGMAAASLMQRGIDLQTGERVLHHLALLESKALHFALQALDAAWGRKGGLAGHVLAEFSATDENQAYWSVIDRFLRSRIQLDDTPCHGEWLELLDTEERDNLMEQVRKLDRDLARDLRRFIREWAPARIDHTALRRLGRVWDATEIDHWPPVVIHEALVERIERGIASLSSVIPRSILFVGDPGVGKTCAVRALCAQLARCDWTVFELTATQLLAGQSSVGQLEARLESLVSNLSRARESVWYVPDLPALLTTGRHSKSEVGVLEMMASDLQDGRIRLVGEVEPEVYQWLKMQFPRVSEFFQIIRVEPQSAESALDLAYRWNRQQARFKSGIRIAKKLVADAAHMVGRYRGDQAMPGALMRVLTGAVRRATQRRENGQKRARVSFADMDEAMNELTGIPPHILRPKRPISRRSIERFLTERVIGQDAAVASVADCVARMLGGLARNDKRPYGVFLFTGGTGTGKTELAKALACLLSGESQALVRIDMSELNIPGTEERLLAAPGGTNHQSLISQIRQRPFSVVLLDEFEKAHPQIHNIFLQVFDEGRLTDHGGRTACFRNCLFILTSNLGARQRPSAAVGFVRKECPDITTDTMKAVKASLSLEFRNRLTDVLEFKPLSPAALERILEMEMREVHRVPLLASRQIRFILQPQAREFLIASCSVENLGARPLSRAVDRHVLGAIRRYLARSVTCLHDCTLYIDEGHDGLLVTDPGDCVPADSNAA